MPLPRSDLYTGMLPADLILVCGVFSGISDVDISWTITHLPPLCAPGADSCSGQAPGAADLTPPSASGSSTRSSLSLVRVCHGQASAARRARISALIISVSASR
jgi:hypothetical protein